MLILNFKIKIKCIGNVSIQNINNQSFIIIYKSFLENATPLI